MEKEFALDELFKFSSKLEHEFDGLTITIDNLYENSEEIYEWLKNQSYPYWKYNPERNSNNSKVYNDCRLVFNNAHPTRLYFAEIERLLNICRQYYWKGEYQWDMLYEFNCFQTITEFDSKVQHYPHTDDRFDTPDTQAVLNCLIYLDKEEDGGTAVYDGEWISNDERFNLLYPVEELFTLERVIPAKFNRCVIFPGNRLHGGFIEDYKKYSGDKWRYTQVIFFNPQRGS